jgi:hypothetical protein
MHQRAEVTEVLTKDVAIQKQHRGERLILGGRAHTTVDGQRRQEPRHVAGAHLRRMPLAVKQNVPPDPPDVRVFRSGAVVTQPERVPHAIEETRRFGRNPTFRRHASITETSVPVSTARFCGGGPATRCRKLATPSTKYAEIAIPWPLVRIRGAEHFGARCRQTP